MTSRTTSWSSTTSTVSCMRPVSPKDSTTGIPEKGCDARSHAVHTAFLLMRGLHGRPVRRDRGISEVAVRFAVPREELPVGVQELVDAPIRGDGAPPREPVGLPEADELLGPELARRAYEEVPGRRPHDDGAGAAESTRRGLLLGACYRVEDPDPVAPGRVAVQERLRARAA